MMTPSDIKTLYQQEGYVVVPGLLGTHKQVLDLRRAAERVIQRTRQGDWPHRRPVGRQFPPYDAEEKDVWGVQHLMHPDLHESSFSAWYTSDGLLNVIKELLGCQDGDLQMELFNLLINPVSHDFALRWHRDDIPDDATEEEEHKALNVWHHGVQWNTALYEDACLLIVPRSHKYPRTQEQREKSSGFTLDDPLDMPGSIRTTLQRMYLDSI
ncbi:hypothetical protein D9619_008719 [Psilocybe cf. subviscida]|uniref:Phytanoyl-CoA dioxygenase family protein n=1 Tax=Psilocybe cf. subviscida TaxID=2480587 RepID=A0A8H5BBS5_9AGAR|nr:hypothetical protein D9619_008719 [Psilocybe cf. subviscida]